MSPVLGPLRGLNLEWTSRAAGRASCLTLVAHVPSVTFRLPLSSPVLQSCWRRHVLNESASRDEGETKAMDVGRKVSFMWFSCRGPDGRTAQSASPTWISRMFSLSCTYRCTVIGRFLIQLLQHQVWALSLPYQITRLPHHNTYRYHPVLNYSIFK